MADSISDTNPERRNVGCNPGRVRMRPSFKGVRASTDVPRSGAVLKALLLLSLSTASVSGFIYSLSSLGGESTKGVTLYSVEILLFAAAAAAAIKTCTGN